MECILWQLGDSLGGSHSFLSLSPEGQDIERGALKAPNYLCEVLTEELGHCLQTTRNNQVLRETLTPMGRFWGQHISGNKGI